MTAPDGLARPEAEATWRPAPGARRRDVILVLGETTLIIEDRGARALAHWSLPAIERTGRGPPAIYAPGNPSDEELEIADPAMIAALEEVRAAVARRQARPGAVRTALLAGLLILVLGLAALWLPDALARHTARVLPASTRVEIGDALLVHVTRLTGPSCAASPAHGPLLRLHRRVRGDAAGRLVLVPGGPREALHLPGGTIVLRRTLVEDHEEPAVIAGFVLAETVRQAAHDPVLAMLEAAGPLTTFRLLTMGRVAEPVLAAEAERLVTADPVLPPSAELVAAIAAADVPTTPYAYALDMTGEATLPLVEADPVDEPATPILEDGDWVALQGACGG